MNRHEAQPLSAFRSVLYLPANNERALAKAPKLPADALILDLEDAVAPDVKSAARASACEAFAGGQFSHRHVALRINDLDTPWGADDLAAAVSCNPQAILLPKISTPEALTNIQTRLAALEANPNIRLWLMLETPLAIINAATLASLAHTSTWRVECLVMGTNDLAKDTGASLAKARLAVLPWLSQCVLAARAYGLVILDGVFNHYQDQDGFIAECRQGKDLGMDGKTLIHPSQIESCNAVFSPSEEEVAWARRVIAAFDAEQHTSANVLSIDGKMVERLHADMARTLLSRHEREA